MVRNETIYKFAICEYVCFISLLSLSHKKAAVNLTLIIIDYIVRYCLVTESLENKLALLVRDPNWKRG